VKRKRRLRSKLDAASKKGGILFGADLVSTGITEDQMRARVGQQALSKADHDSKANDNVELPAWMIGAVAPEFRAAA
jgi:hypothetical protein